MAAFRMTKSFFVSVHRCGRRSIRLVLIGLLSAVSLASAQEPVVQRIDAVGLTPGQQTALTVHGTQLKNCLLLWTPVAEFRTKEGYDPNADGPVAFEGKIPIETVPGIYPARVITAGGCSEASFVVIDDLPSAAVAAESEVQSQAPMVPLSCSMNGQINPVKPRFFKLQAAQGQVISAEVFARRLNSQLDPVLRVTDASGRELAFCDDLPGLEGDAGVQFTAPADGEYLLELRDALYSGGGLHFFHLRIGQFPIVTATQPRVATAGQSIRLLSSGVDAGTLSMPSDVFPAEAFVNHAQQLPDVSGTLLLSLMTVSGAAVSEVEPNDTQETATVVGAEQNLICGTLRQSGDIDWFRITAESAMPLCVTAHTRNVRSPADVVLQLWSADGKKIAEADDTPPLDAQLVAPLPAAGDYFLRVSELAGLGGAEWTYDLEVNRGEGRLELVLPSDRLQVPRGGSASFLATVKRLNYDGPLVIEAEQLPASLTMEPIWLGAKQSTVAVTLKALEAVPPAAEADAEGATPGESVGGVPPAEFGVFRLTAAAPERNPGIPVSVRLVSPPPKKAAIPFRSIRSRSDVFVATAPAGKFSLNPEVLGVDLKRGASAAVVIKAARHADWTMPIDIALVTKPDQLPPGITIPNVKLEGGEAVLTINATADAALGKFTVFVQGTAKKDKETATHPVPPITVDVTE